jgi:tRNA A37 threonylcarbamoyltransferase TsaD
MKYTIMGMVVVVLGGMALNGYLNEPTEAVNVKVEKETVEVHPDWSTDEDAVAAAQAVIDRKRAEAELEDVQSEIEALEAREMELEKELLVY